MKKWRKLFGFFLILICILGIFGCSREKIIDKLSIVHVFGFDQADNGEIIGSVLIPEYTKSKASDQIQYLEEQAPTSVIFVQEMAAQTSTPVELAKIRVLLFGKSYAEAGIQDMVDRFVVTPQLGTNIQIAASTHSARETLKTFKKEKSLTLAERIDHNIQGQNLPKMNLHEFLNHYYGDGMDAYVPMISTDGKDKTKVEGIGVFKNDKLKLELNTEQTAIFSVLNDFRSQAIYKMNLDEEEQREFLMVRGFRNKSNWNWNPKKGELNLRLKLKMTLTRYPDRFNIEKADDVKEMKKIIVEELEKSIEDLLGTFKENEVDPLGIGNIVRSKDRTWEEESFYKKYPTLPIHVKVDLKIIHSGLES